MKLHHSMELSGLAIVLLAITFQLTLMSKVVNVADRGYLVRIDEKVNLIWLQVKDRNTTEDEEIQRANYFNEWISSDRDYLEDQKNWFTDIYAVIMILGSTLLVIGRYLEIKDRPRVVQNSKQSTDV